MLLGEVISLKNKQNEAYKEQENEILKLRQQVEEGRKAAKILKKQHLEKEEKYQVQVNILKGKLEEKDKLLRFQDSTKILDDTLIFLVVNDPLLSKLVLVFMNLLKVNLAHMVRQATLMQNLKCSTGR